MAAQSIDDTGAGERRVRIESGSRPGYFHWVDELGRHCSCEAASFGAKDCSHRRIQRAKRRFLLGEDHRIEERSDAYNHFFVVVDGKGNQVTGPTTSRLEALMWACEEDAAPFPKDAA